MKKNTPEVIVTKAVELFNADGSHSVTTNHIARACGMSPGNLYYHFKNKEEIIRAIFARISAEFSESWGEKVLEEEGYPDIVAKSQAMGVLYYRYRFFYLELPSLLAQDTLLAHLYHENEKIKHAIIRRIIHVMIEKKLVKQDFSPAEIETFVSSSWILTDFWLSYLFVSGEAVTPESIMRGMDNYISFLIPYLNPRGMKAIFTKQ